MATEDLSQEDQEFLALVEEELKDRYTEKDENFMKVFNSEVSVPPIVENLYPSGRRNNFRRYNDRPRDRGNYGRYSGYHDNRDQGQGSYSSQKRGYNDNEDHRDSGYHKRRRY